MRDFRELKVWKKAHQLVEVGRMLSVFVRRLKDQS